MQIWGAEALSSLSLELCVSKKKEMGVDFTSGDWSPLTIKRKDVEAVSKIRYWTGCFWQFEMRKTGKHFQKSK